MSARRALDRYFTPAWQTRALLAHQEISGVVLEPCAGDGGIARVLRDHSRVLEEVITNDIDRGLTTQFNLDASQPQLYVEAARRAVGKVDWVISNPPYTMPLCRDIVVQAVKQARVGVAMLLRLSFLEPTATKNPRGPWLEQHPPSRNLILPRYSYTQDGNTDSCTTVWMIWLRHEARRENLPCIRCLYRADERYAEPRLEEASA